MSTDKTPDPLDVALGAAIRIRRRSLGISQEALADRCGVSFQQVQKYENGANRVSFSRLLLVARALQCRIADLMEGLDVDETTRTDELDLLPRLMTPGALELLTAYEALPAEARGPFIGLVQAMADRSTEETPAS
jgi:transcriptional regulator with XRE-family HTH domain